MEEPREAVRVLADAAQQIDETQTIDEVPSPDQLAALQKTVDRVQRSLNQTAMDNWTEAKEDL